MKVLKISNGEIRNGFEFKDLSEEAQEIVLQEQINFEIMLLNDMQEKHDFFYIAKEMKRMQTPWFLASEIYDKHKDDLIESIEANGYLFDEDGDLLPIVYHMKENKVVRTVFNNRYEVEILEGIS